VRERAFAVFPRSLALLGDAIAKHSSSAALEGRVALKRKQHLLQVGQYALAVVGVVALGYWATVSLTARLYQAKETRAFEGRLQSQQREKERGSVSRSTTTAKHESPVEGSAVARLAIPRLGLASIVVEGVEERDLRVAPGHIPGTPLPGQAGNVAIAGHRDTFFRPLRFIRKNDIVSLTTLRGEDQYRVVSTDIVAPGDIQVLYPTGRDTLTLVTCYPFDYVGPAPSRFIVRAERSGGEQTTSPSGHRRVPEAKTAAGSQ
jgi:sortase A